MRRTPEGMRRAAIVLAALAVVLSLGGCFADEEPVPTTTPVPSATPIFATEEEALAAAEEAYKAYLELSDEVGAEGGHGVDRLIPYVTEGQLEDERQSFKEYEAEGISTRGSTGLVEFQLQQAPISEMGVTKLFAYACLDASEIRVFDKNGAELSTPNRPEKQTFQVDFELRPEVADQFLLNGMEIWDGEGIC